MHRISAILVFTLFPAFILQAQDALHTSTVTFGVGGETPTYNQFGESTGPAFAGNYEYRILKYLAIEAGLETILPRQTNYGYAILPGINLVTAATPTLCTNGCVFFAQTDRTRVSLVPFGGKGILPLASDRVELFAGGGGAYAFHSDGTYRNAILVQANLGGRIALDHGHHFWLGTSGHFFSNFGKHRQEWVTWTADIGIRF